VLIKVSFDLQTGSTCVEHLIAVGTNHHLCFSHMPGSEWVQSKIITQFMLSVRNIKGSSATAKLKFFQDTFLSEWRVGKVLGPREAVFYATCSVESNNVVRFFMDRLVTAPEIVVLFYWGTFQPPVWFVAWQNSLNTFGECFFILNVNL